MAEPDPKRDLAHNITMALIESGSVRDSAYTVVSRLIRDQLVEHAQKENPADREADGLR